MDNMRNRYRAPRRDYGLPPIPSPSAAQPTSSGQAQNPTHTKIHRRPLIILILVVLIGLITAGWFILSNSTDKSTIPLEIVSKLSFPAYYPSKLPAGYSYTDGSAKLQTGLFYYKLHKGTKIITVTQQPVQGSIDLKKLPKYSSLNVPAGPAALGVSVGNPSAVIATGSTLVSINSSKGVSKDDVITVAKNIKPIKAESSG
jgi:hypothetical protein